MFFLGYSVCWNSKLCTTAYAQWNRTTGKRNLLKFRQLHATCYTTLILTLYNTSFRFFLSEYCKSYFNSLPDFLIDKYLPFRFFSWQIPFISHLAKILTIFFWVNYCLAFFIVLGSFGGFENSCPAKSPRGIQSNGKLLYFPLMASLIFVDFSKSTKILIIFQDIFFSKILPKMVFAKY